MLFKRKKRIKRSKYKFKASDYEITTLVSFIEDAVNELKQAISEEKDASLLCSLIYKKYALMELASRLGFSPFNEELDNRKPIDREIKFELDKHKKVDQDRNQIVIDSNKETVVENKGSETTW